MHSHKKKSKLICNVFPENGVFCVMICLSNKEFQSVYGELSEYAQKIIDNKYPCNEGGWIHFRVMCRENMNDIIKIASVK